jgi:ATP-dependent RNA helicase DDX18/HAS1
LHQSARDGFRSYLQAYASYSLKKIFDINALDLAKVGKAFGFAVPPRVNVNIGGGKTTTTGNKRRRNEVDADDEEWEDMPLGGGAESGDEVVEEESQRNKPRRKEKERRVETLGKKAVEKEMYRKGKERKRAKASGQQWSG